MITTSLLLMLFWLFNVVKWKAYSWGITWFLELQGTQKPRRTSWKRNQPCPIQEGTYPNVSLSLYNLYSFLTLIMKISQNELLMAEIEYMQKRVSNVSSISCTVFLGFWVSYKSCRKWSCNTITCTCELRLV